MNYVGMLTNHKARGSGYAEILLEAGLAKKGCLKNILPGKALAKTMFNLKVTVAALDRPLIDVFADRQALKYILKLFLMLFKCVTEIT